jgi:hypothetical protein
MICCENEFIWDKVLAQLTSISSKYLIGNLGSSTFIVLGHMLANALGFQAIIAENLAKHRSRWNFPP